MTFSYYLFPEIIVLELSTREPRKIFRMFIYFSAKTFEATLIKLYSTIVIDPVISDFLLCSPIMNISVKETDDFLRGTKSVIMEARFLRLKSVATRRISSNRDDRIASRPMKNLSNKKIDVASRANKNSRKNKACSYKESDEISSIIRELRQVKESIVADMDKKNNSKQGSSLSQSELRSIHSFFKASHLLLSSFEEQPRHEEQETFEEEEEEGRILHQRRKASSSSSTRTTSSVRFDLGRNKFFLY